MGIFLYKNLSIIESFEAKLTSGLKEFFSIFNIALVVIGIFIFFYTLNKIYNFFKDKIQEKKNRNSTIFWCEMDLKELMKKYGNNEIGLEKYVDRLKNFLKTFPDYFELGGVKALASAELIKAEKRSIEEEHENKIFSLNYEKEELEREIRRKKFFEKEEILKNFDLTKQVFMLKDLVKKEIDALIENGFIQVNEYDVFERKRIPILIKPFHHHSIAHTFLVWSVRRLVESFGVEDIGEFLTVDADVVFEFDGKKYAVEIECGSLLGKKNQLSAKLKDLNKKYPKRWLFLVSHRDLFSKYRRFGPTSTRAELDKKLRKMLKMPHPQKVDVS